jgi:O-antigen/teichoic acid export membrane protein
MPTSNKRLKTFLSCVGFVVLWLAGFAGIARMVELAISKVASGRGLETYRTVWLVEFNYIGFLVTLVGVVVALLIAAGFWLRDWLQWRKLEKKYSGGKESA